MVDPSSAAAAPGLVLGLALGMVVGMASGCGSVERSQCRADLRSCAQWCEAYRHAKPLPSLSEREECVQGCTDEVQACMAAAGEDAAAALELIDLMLELGYLLP